MTPTSRTCLVLLAVPLLLLVLSPPVLAQTFVGNFCWSLNPFTDTIQVAITEYPDGIFGLNVRWRGVIAGSNPFGSVFGGLVGPASYQVQGSGTAAADLDSPTNVELSVAIGANSLPPGNRSCTLSGAISTSTGNGSWSVLCPASAFSTGGSLILATCPSGS